MQFLRPAACVLLLIVQLCTVVPAPAQVPAQAGQATAVPRQLVVISDLHLGAGRQADGAWIAHEDFRWPNALRGFLAEIDKIGSGRTDLVIAGDFLELWQPPQDIVCNGPSGAMCSAQALARLTRRIALSHQDELSALAAFAAGGDNRLYIVPGNHDAALLVPEVWSEIAQPLKASSGRVILVGQGIFVTPDGKVVVEHGHQIGADVNAFSTWPDPVRLAHGAPHLESPWGERFVQTLFNDREASYPIIDNLSPESAGAKLLMAERGFWGSAQDMARFLRFNLFETTLRQKGGALGERGAEQACTAATARGRGAGLFIDALLPDDPLRIELSADTAQAEALREALATQAASLPDDEATDLCRQSNSHGTLGAVVQQVVAQPRDVMRHHLIGRRENFPSLAMFVYAHSHQLAEPWTVDLAFRRSITVLNSGAFQRLLSEAGYDQRVAAMKLDKRSDGLSRIALESLAPCFSFVQIVQAPDGKRAAATRIWRMAETDRRGEFLAPDDPACR